MTDAAAALLDFGLAPEEYVRVLDTTVNAFFASTNPTEVRPFPICKCLSAPTASQRLHACRPVQFDSFQGSDMSHVLSGHLCIRCD